MKFCESTCLKCFNSFTKTFCNFPMESFPNIIKQKSIHYSPNFTHKGIQLFMNAWIAFYFKYLPCFFYLNLCESEALLSMSFTLISKQKLRCFHCDGRFWVKRSTSFPRQGLRSLKLLQRFLFIQQNKICRGRNFSSQWLSDRQQVD